MPEISTSASPEIFYRKSGSGPVLILLHGFPESSDIWRAICDDLSASFTLIMPDLPGSGKSVLKGDTSISQMAGCIKEIMDHEDIDKAVIAGHSMGGYVAFAFAGMYPERLAGLSLIHSTPLADDEEKKKMRRKTIELIRNGGKEAFIKQMIPNLFSASFKQTQPEVVEDEIIRGLKMEDAGMINFYNAMLHRPDRVNVLKNAATPVQWFIGMEDNIIFYKKILELCHHSHINFVYLYNNCGHMGMFEAPEKLVAGLKEFVHYSYDHANELR